MYPITLCQRLVVPLLLCFVMSLLPASILFNGLDQGGTGNGERPAPTSEEDEVKNALPYATANPGDADPGSPLIEVARATNDRLLPSPHGEVQLRPPKRLL